MFELDVDDRLSSWSSLRKQIDESSDPFHDVISFWNKTPFVAHNHKIDPFNSNSWPTPWEIIVENRYDDFTRAVMIGYTLLLTEKFKNSKIIIKTLVDNEFKRLYNVVNIDDTWVLNFNDTRVLHIDDISGFFNLENLVVLSRPR